MNPTNLLADATGLLVQGTHYPHRPEVTWEVIATYDGLPATHLIECEYPVGDDPATAYAIPEGLECLVACVASAHGLDVHVEPVRAIRSAIPATQPGHTPEVHGYDGEPVALQEGHPGEKVWGVCVWPNGTVGQRRVDEYIDRTTAERMIGDTYGTHAELVWRHDTTIALDDEAIWHAPDCDGDHGHTGAPCDPYLRGPIRRVPIDFDPACTSCNPPPPAFCGSAVPHAPHTHGGKCGHGHTEGHTVDGTSIWCHGGGDPARCPGLEAQPPQDLPRCEHGERTHHRHYDGLTLTWCPGPQVRCTHGHTHPHGTDALDRGPTCPGPGAAFRYEAEGVTIVPTCQHGETDRHPKPGHDDPRQSDADAWCDGPTRQPYPADTTPNTQAMTVEWSDPDTGPTQGTLDEARQAGRPPRDEAAPAPARAHEPHRFTVTLAEASPGVWTPDTWGGRPGRLRDVLRALADDLDPAPAEEPRAAEPSWPLVCETRVGEVKCGRILASGVCATHGTQPRTVPPPNPGERWVRDEELK